MLGIGSVCGIVTVDARFRTPEWRTWRTGLFVGMGASTVVPVLHGLKVYGFEALQERIALGWVISQWLTYVLGAAIYAVSSLSSLLFIGVEGGKIWIATGGANGWSDL